MKTIINKTPSSLVKTYGLAEYQIKDNEGIQIGSLSTEYLFSSGKYHALENKEDAEKDLESHVKKIAAVDELLENLIRCVDRLEENGMGDMSAVKRAKEAIRKATE